MFCQAASTQREFWICLYSSGKADVPMEEVIESWNNKFAYFNEGEGTFRWISIADDYTLSTMPRGATDTNQGWDDINSDANWATTVHYTTEGNTPLDIINLVFEPTVEVLGCTYEGSTNYNEEANVDDGSCSYDPRGCTDETALNYNPQATADNGLICKYSDGSGSDGSGSDEGGFDDSEWYEDTTTQLVVGGVLAVGVLFFVFRKK